MQKILIIKGLVLGVVLLLPGGSLALGRINTDNLEPTIIIGPYTQNSQMNSITILWETNGETTNNTVQWGFTSDVTASTKETGLFKHTTHRVILEDLVHSTTYYYKVVSDTSESAVYTFCTSNQQQDEVRFIVYGDSRGGWDNWTATRLVAHAIENKKPQFVLNTGDLVDNGTNAEDWVDFFTASGFVHNSTLYPVLGNHERYGSPYFRYFSLPHNKRWYSFDNGPVHFIGLDSNPRNAYRLIQLVWLLQDLRKHSQPFTIVFFHHPLYSSGQHGNSTLLRSVWKPIFEHYNVNMVMNGHDHDYERSIVNNITYIVTGGGGAPLYDVGDSSWTIYSEKTFHYCLITVNTTQLTFEAIKPDGTVFDHFTLMK